MSQLIDSMLADYSSLDAPFCGSGESAITVQGRIVQIEWDRIEYPSGAVRHGVLRFMGTFEGALITRQDGTADGSADIQNVCGHVIAKLDSIDRYALAAHLLKMRQS